MHVSDSSGDRAIGADGPGNASSGLRGMRGGGKRSRGRGEGRGRGVKKIRAGGDRGVGDC
jgi:hypothetical protein